MGDKTKGIIGRVILMGEADILKNSDWYLVPSAMKISRLWAMSESIDYSKVAFKADRNAAHRGGRYE